MPAPPARNSATAGDSSGTIADLVAIIERASDAILTCDHHGLLLTWNRSAERLWGWGPAEVLGGSAVDLLFPRHLRAEARKLTRRVLAGETLEDVEIEARRRDGMLIAITLNSFPLVDEAGGV